MKTLIILAVIVMVVVQGNVDHWNLIHFTKNEDQLRECLEEQTDLLKVLRENVNDTDWEYYVIDRLSHLTHSLTTAVVNTDALSSESVNILRVAISGLYEDQLELIQKAIKSALVRCSDPIDGASSRHSEYHELPRFVQEAPELADLFNLMLVKPDIDSSNDYVTALSLIESSLRRLHNSSELNNVLLRMWERRARLFFDDNNLSEKYIWHVNIVDHPRPCTTEDPGWYNQRMRVDFHVRDQREFSQSNGSHVFLFQNTTRLTGSRLYYEERRSQFLRAMFLHLELLEQGFVGPSINLPNNLSDILFGSMDYFTQYFDNRQRMELSHGFANNSVEFSSSIQSLQPGDRIDELDLLMMFWYRLRSRFSTTVPTTTFSYGESNKSNGYVTKKYRMMNAKEYDYGNPGPSSSNNVTCFQQTEYYGHISVSENSRQNQPIEEEKIFLGIMQDFFSSTTISEESRCD